mgnify:CR=1 FL=1
MGTGSSPTNSDNLASMNGARLGGLPPAEHHRRHGPLSVTKQYEPPPVVKADVKIIDISPYLPKLPPGGEKALLTGLDRPCSSSP